MAFKTLPSLVLYLLFLLVSWLLFHVLTCAMCVFRANLLPFLENIIYFTIFLYLAQAISVNWNSLSSPFHRAKSIYLLQIQFKCHSLCGMPSSYLSEIDTSFHLAPVALTQAFLLQHLTPSDLD